MSLSKEERRMNDSVGGEKIKLTGSICGCEVDSLGDAITGNKDSNSRNNAVTCYEVWFEQ